MEGFRHDDGYFDHTGLIYDGRDSGDPGLGVKKLAYYTYKLMTEKLEGSNWDSTRTLIDGTDNVYAYKFIKAQTGKPIYVAWWDYFADSSYVHGNTKSVNLKIGNADSVRIIETVPDAQSGADLNPDEYPAFFASETKPVTNGTATIILGENPVFVEELSSLTSVGEGTGWLIPGDSQLEQNYPNPFNPQTSIEYHLPKPSHVVFRIYNSLGQAVRALADENQLPGGIRWSGMGRMMRVKAWVPGSTFLG